MTNLKEQRTHFFIKIYLSHFILERVVKGLQKGWCWLCVRGELETGTYCYILTQSSSDYSSTSSLFLLGCSTVGHWGPKPSVWSWFSLRWHPLSNCNCNCNSNSLEPSVAPGYIIVWHPPASCGRTHLHRIQPRPQVKVIFRYLRLDASVSLSSAYLLRCISWLTAWSRINMLHLYISYLSEKQTGIIKDKRTCRFKSERKKKRKKKKNKKEKEKIKETKIKEVPD